MHRVHVVRPGDCIESIAARAGWDFRELWEHEGNRELRERRTNPSLLGPGDLVHIPASFARRPLPIEAGSTHQFRARAPLTSIRLRLVRDEDSGDGQPAPAAPLAGVAYRLRAGMLTIEGTTDNDGNLEAHVPATLQSALLIVAPGSDDERWLDLQIGHLDPLEEPSGVAQRLENLGLLSDAGTAAGLRHAISTFQTRHGLTGAGELTPETTAKLREVHDG